VRELDRALITGRAAYEGWLGTEPAEIAAAMAALCRLDPHHPLLGELATRLRRANTVKEMLQRCSAAEATPSPGRGRVYAAAKPRPLKKNEVTGRDEGDPARRPCG
jgi:hypothetical protein